MQNELQNNPGMETDVIAAAWVQEAGMTDPAEEIVHAHDDDGGESIDGKAPKTPKSKRWGKYSRRYNKSWEKEADFTQWLMPVVGDEKSATCRFCRCTLRAHHADLKQHSRTDKHQKNATKFTTVSQLGVGMWQQCTSTGLPHASRGGASRARDQPRAGTLQ